jgi:hypothetical protein
MFLEQVLALFPDTKLKSKKVLKMKDAIMSQYKDEYNRISKLKSDI